MDSKQSLKRYQATTREYRNYLRENGLALRYELDNKDDYFKSQSEHIKYYRKIYRSFLPEDASAPILEIGCSEGLFLGFLKNEGYTNFKGIDLAPEKIEIAMKYHPGCVAIDDAFSYLHNINNTYELIAANFVLEHIPKDSTIEFLKTVNKALKNNGIFIASVPNMDCPLALFARYMDFTHQVGFTMESLIWVIFEAGFKNMQVYDASPTSSKFCSRMKYAVSRRIIEYLGRSIGVRNLKKCISESIFCVGYK